MEAQSTTLGRLVVTRPAWLRTSLGVFTVTLSGFVAAGAALPVLPRFVHGPLHAGDVEVGLVIGAYSLAAVLVRPLAGRTADRRGRQPVLLVGALLTAVAGALLLAPASLPQTVAARLVQGGGEGLLFTAGSAWIVDLAPHDRQGQAIGLFGLSVWGGMTVGPLVGDQLLSAAGFHAVWWMMLGVPLIGAVVAWRLPEAWQATANRQRRPWIPRPVVGPGVALALANAGYATMAAFVVLHLARRGVGHGALVFAAYAAAVVGSRLLFGHLPDRLGPRASAVLAGLAEAAGLAIIAMASSLPVALVGGVVMGTGFSLLYPALALGVVRAVGERDRGTALGGFTAFFDIGMGLGAPLAGGIASIGGYGAAFWAAAGIGLGAAAIAAYAVPSQ